MATITTRSGKGSPLTNSEVDSNFSNINTELGQKESASNKGVANGYASLDGSGKVPSAQLPSYVDDVVEGANLASLPATGETGKIYVTLDTNKTYRWSGSAYVEISASPGSTDAVTEGSTNLYFTNARARSAISASGSLSYNSSTGVLSYTAPTAVSQLSNDSGYITSSALSPYLTSATAASTYQTALVSGTSIKTVNGNSLLGSGNIQIDAGVSSFNTRTGAITLTSGDVTTALGFTPYNATNPSGYITSSASITGNAATATNSTQLGGFSKDYFVYGDTSNTGSINTYIPDGGIGANAIARSCFFRDNESNFTALGIHIQHANNGGYGVQIGSDYAGTTWRVRAKVAGTWGSSATLLTSANYNSYSPTLTGTGASGTWGIRITGFANQGTARLYSTDAAYNYDSGAPYYGYLTYDGSRWLFQVSPGTPAAVRVAYADAAGSATDSTKLPLSGGTLTGSRPIQISPSDGALFITGSSGGWSMGTYFKGTSGTIRAGFGALGSNNDLSYAWIGTGYDGAWMTLTPSAVNSTVALQQGGNQVLHAGNYSSYALPLSGGTVSGTTNFSSGITVNNASADGRGINLYSGSPTSPDYGLFFAQTGNFGTYGAVSADWATYFTMNSTAHRGWIFREHNSLGNVAAISNQGNMTLRSHFEQGNNIARPNVSWSVGGTSTGMVIFYLPGTTGNYGMVHMVFDIYEYNGNAVSTVIVGGHNWSTSWYNTGANVIGQCGKEVRLGCKDGRFCVVFGTSGSSWEYGTIVLRKIHNGGFYDNIMDMVGNWSSTQTTTESFTNITGDLRALRTPASFNAGGAITQAGNQVLHAGNYSSGYFKTINGSSIIGTGDLTVSGTDSTKLPLSGGTMSGILYSVGIQPTGVGGNSGVAGDNDYKWGYQEAGAWSHPYPDLILAYHTGIKFGANTSYGGMRFYADHPYRNPAELFSVGNGDSHVRVANNLYVGGNLALHAGNYNSYAMAGAGYSANQNLLTSSAPTFADVYTNGWFRNNESGEGIYNQATSNHFYSDGQYWNVGYSGTTGIRLRNGHAGTVLGYLYAETNGNFGLLDQNGNWAIRVYPGSNGGGLLYNQWQSTGGFRTNRWMDYDGNFLFRQGTSSGVTRHLNLADTESDPSVATGTGISWGQRTDGSPYYMIYTRKYDRGSGLGDYTRLQLSWHTGIDIGGTYGGTRFYNNSPWLGSEVFSVANGDSNVRVVNTLYSYAYRGNGNVAGTGEAIYAPAGVYSTGTNWLYGTIYTNGNQIFTSGGTVNCGAVSATGQLYINNNDPTIYLQDASHRSSMIHCNSNVFYVLRGTGTNSTGWATYNGYWPMELALENNDATFGGNVTAIYNVTAYSDERLKKNWRSLPERFVERLACVKNGVYERICVGEEAEVTQVGVSAQSLREVLPEAVTEATDEIKTLSVSYGNAALAAAVELAKELVMLKRELAEIKSRLH